MRIHQSKSSTFDTNSAESYFSSFFMLCFWAMFYMILYTVVSFESLSFSYWSSISFIYTLN